MPGKFNDFLEERTYFLGKVFGRRQEKYHIMLDKLRLKIVQVNHLQIGTTKPTNSSTPRLAGLLVDDAIKDLGIY